MQTEHEAETLIERRPGAKAHFPLLNEMWVEPGSKTDWDLLHELHYKDAERLPVGPTYWKLTLNGETVGVILLGQPNPLLKERNVLLRHYKPGSQDTHITNVHRYKWVNANMIVISRFVLDTMYRGIGAGYRFQNLVSRLSGRRFVEIQSSMAKHNFFAQKAGFSFVKPMNANRFDEGVRFFRQHFETTPQDYEGLVAELEAMPPRLREKTTEAVRAFYYKHSPKEKTGARREKGLRLVGERTGRQLIRDLQQLVLASPLYGIYENPDYGRTLPQRLPLSAFDRQRATDPLILDCPT